jgi:magnesium-protoporphyrin O-methyltransferase
MDMPTGSYTQRRSEVEEYFDRTAAQTWARLTSTAPVGRVRATVRAGRDRMRDLMLSWLPADLCGARVLDAGCGTGAFSVALAERGAEVVAVDLSPTLVELARERAPKDFGRAGGSIEFRCGDMLGDKLGRFDHVVAMDSLIHYDAKDAARSLAALAPRVRTSMLFTFAPRTPLLAAMHAIGRFFPKADRAPAIQPVAEGDLWQLMSRQKTLLPWSAGRCERVASGFYTSQAMEWRRA